MPGERGLGHKAMSLTQGLTLHPSIMPLLQPWADQWQIACPTALP
jgi:hypothetical protein